MWLTQSPLSSNTSLRAFRSPGLVFALGALALSGSLLILYSNRLGWFEKRLTIYVVSTSSQGLLPGAPVQMSGLRIGAIRSVDILPDGRVRLALNIRQKYQPFVSPRSKATLTPASLLGSGSIAVSPAPIGSKPTMQSFQISAHKSSTLESFLEGAETTRGDLQQLLRTTNKIAEYQLPTALGQLSKTLASAQQTSDIVNQQLPRLSDSLNKAMAIYSKTGESADEVSREALATLQSIRPDLEKTLQEFSLLMQRSNQLLNQFSFLMEPADPPSSQGQSETETDD